MSEGAWLLFRAGRRRLALPLASVVETMPMPAVQTVADPPAGILGVAVVRGALLPVADAGTLIAEARAPAARIRPLTSRAAVATSSKRAGSSGAREVRASIPARRSWACREKERMEARKLAS